MRLSGFRLLLLSSLTLSATGVAAATTTTVRATDAIYAVGTNSSAAVGYGSTAPSAITFAPDTLYFTFFATGNVTLNAGANINNADGVGSVGFGGFTGDAGLSAINTADGSLSAVFIGAGGPSGTAPATLDFTGAGSTAFLALNPLLDQVFFVGDGLTGNGTGTTQKFYVPDGATALYLGIADSCGYDGVSSCYNDNSGAFAVNYSTTGGKVPPSVTPEPSSLILLGTGCIGFVSAMRRRFHRA